MPSCRLGLASSIVEDTPIQDAAHGEVRVVYHAERRRNVKQNGEKHGAHPITPARANQDRQTNILFKVATKETMMSGGGQEARHLAKGLYAACKNLQLN